MKQRESNSLEIYWSCTSFPKCMITLLVIKSSHLKKIILRCAGLLKFCCFQESWNLVKHRDLFHYYFFIRIVIHKLRKLPNTVFDLLDRMLHPQKLFVRHRHEAWCRIWFLIQQLMRQTSVPLPKVYQIAIRPLAI